MNKDKNVLAGYGLDAVTQEQRPVITGDKIFKLMDSHGLPLDLLVDLMKTHNLSYDVYGFIVAAYASKNYTEERLVNLLLPPSNNVHENCKELIYFAIHKVYHP